MTLRHPDGASRDLPLTPRSLLVLQGEARYLWSCGPSPSPLISRHGISARRTDWIDGRPFERGRRLSLTFRTIRARPCDCSYRAQCDSWLAAPQGPVSSPIEATFVRDVYDAIAPHFTATRQRPWPRVAAFLNSLTPGSVVADVGCGNGKYLGVNSSLAMLGNDQSEPLLAIARSRTHEVAVMNALALPIRDNSCDAAISIAVVHHFSTPAHRLQALNGSPAPPLRPQSSRAHAHRPPRRAPPHLRLGSRANGAPIRATRCAGPVASQGRVHSSRSS
jgi:alkylated DNA repair protein alkB family protein 8